MDFQPVVIIILYIILFRARYLFIFLLVDTYGTANFVRWSHIRGHGKRKGTWRDLQLQKYINFNTKGESNDIKK